MGVGFKDKWVVKEGADVEEDGLGVEEELRQKRKVLGVELYVMVNTCS